MTLKVTTKVNISPKRLKDESFEDYKKRRKLAKKLIARYLKGFTVWNPNMPIGSTGQVAGPHVNALHGEDIGDTIWNKAEFIVEDFTEDETNEEK